jgi:uncharacterized protein (DUF433 family)
MASASSVIGDVDGKTIELEEEPDLPDGQQVIVTARQAESIPSAKCAGDVSRLELWIDRLVFDSAILPGERIVKGTNLAVEALVAELEGGRSDAEMVRAHPGLNREDVGALREYARAPVGLRRAFGAWAEDGKQLDRYIESVYERRRATHRRPIEQ